MACVTETNPTLDPDALEPEFRDAHEERSAETPLEPEAETAADDTTAAEPRPAEERETTLLTARLNDTVRATGSWFDEKWAAFTATPAAARWVEWVLFGLVMLVAVLTRFLAIDHPMKLVFDETFYVKDSWSLVHLGYEGSWPEGANDAWAKGDPNTYSSEASYVVHPPLGKLLIGLGMLIVGADNTFGWRITVALAGLATVALVWFIAKRMFRSVPWAAFAAFLIAIDGHAIVLSRITILDGILVMFVLLGFLFMLYDRDDQRAKIAAGVRTWWLAQDAPLNGEPTPAPVSSTMEAPAEARRGPNWGPRLWNRPWLMAAAAAFACASAVKWSGLYFLAAFCVYSLVIDLLERRRQGVTLWASAGILMQGPISFILTIPLAAAIYLATWIPWLTTTGGYYRTWAEQPGKAWEGLLSWVPLPLQSLWHYQVEAYKFHTTLDATHPYQSSPLGWPFLARPTAFSYDYFKAGDGSGCTEELCVEAINSISNPLIWWIGTAAILVLLVLQFRRPSWRAGMILVGYGAGYLPWLAVLERQAVFHFYAIIMLGFMVLAIVEVVRTIVGTKEDPRSLRTASLAVLFIGIGVVTLVSALFYPIWTGIQIPDSYWRLTQWLPTWK